MHIGIKIFLSIIGSIGFFLLTGDVGDSCLLLVFLVYKSFENKKTNISNEGIYKK